MEHNEFSWLQPRRRPPTVGLHSRGFLLLFPVGRQPNDRQRTDRGRAYLSVCCRPTASRQLGRQTPKAMKSAVRSPAAVDKVPGH